MDLYALTIHAAATVKPQRLALNNREHVVAPVVMVLEGVLNGAYVPASALVPNDWNGMPLIVPHAIDAQGKALSAHDPEVYAHYGVGALYHAALGQARRGEQPVATLCAELWVDVARTEALGGQAVVALQKLEAQIPLEVSTGYYPTVVRQAGEFAGAPYTEVHTRLVPDHLALLPHEVGACSLGDGCGAPRLNRLCCAGCAEGTTCKEVRVESDKTTGWQRFVGALRQFVALEEAQPGLLDSALSAAAEKFPMPAAISRLRLGQPDIDLRENLYSALAREGEANLYCYIESVDEAAQTFVYREGPRLIQRSWTMDGDLLKLAERKEDVQRKTTFVPVPGDENTEGEESPMSPNNARATALITNTATPWTEEDRAALEAMPEAVLLKLETQGSALAVDGATPPASVAEAILQMPEHLRGPLRAMAQEYELRKQTAITRLAANARNVFPRVELDHMDVERLEGLLAMAGDPQAGQGNAYLGLGAPHIRQGAEESMPAPLNVFAEVVKLQQQGRLPAAHTTA